MVALVVLLMLFAPVQESIVAQLDVEAVTSAEVGGLVWSPDGAALALGLSDGRILVWSFEDDGIRWLGEASGYVVYDIAWSLDGQYIAWTADTGIVIWHNTQPPTFSYLSNEHLDIVLRIAFSPDGSLLASVADAPDRSVIIWDMETEKMLHKLEMDEGHFPFSIAFSRDSSTLAVGRILGSVELWDVEIGERLNTLTGLSRETASIVWSPDGNTLAASSEMLLGSTEYKPCPMLTIAAWDVQSGELLYALEETSEGWTGIYGVSKIALSPDGMLLASSTMSGEIHIWDFESGELLDTLEGHAEKVFDLAWSPDGQMLASVSADNTVIIWDNPFDAASKSS